MTKIPADGIVGTLLIPPSRPVSFRGGRVVALRWPEIEGRYPTDSTIFTRPIGYFYDALTRRYPDRKTKKMEFDDYVWTVIEVDDRRSSAHTVAALVDLGTGHYQFYLGEQIRRSKPLPQGQYAHALGRPPLARVRPSWVEILQDGLILARRKPRFAIAIQRWHTSIDRSVPIDAVIDCYASLDSLFNVRQELRLRLAMAVYAYVRSGKRKARSLVYELYGRRNDFVHGSKVPPVADNERRAITELTARILKQCIHAKSLPKLAPDVFFAAS